VVQPFFADAEFQKHLVVGLGAAGMMVKRFVGAWTTVAALKHHAAA